MELHEQIKKYRTERNLSQEELAETVYVTRQSISNWETGKTYPDIHSLLLLSSFFNVSLDQLIKGDIKVMKREINETEVGKLKQYSVIYSIFLAAMVFPLCHA
jgi:transcriptional regulator with XRE-family HTH domain